MKTRYLFFSLMISQLFVFSCKQHVTNADLDYSTDEIIMQPIEPIINYDIYSIFHQFADPYEKNMIQIQKHNDFIEPIYFECEIKGKNHYKIDRNISLLLVPHEGELLDYLFVIKDSKIIRILQLQNTKEIEIYRMAGQGILVQQIDSFNSKFHRQYYTYIKDLSQIDDVSTIEVYVRMYLAGDSCVFSSRTSIQKSGDEYLLKVSSNMDIQTKNDCLSKKIEMIPFTNCALETKTSNKFIRKFCVSYADVVDP